MMPSQWRKGMAATFLVFGASLSAEEILRLPIGDPARRDRDAAVVLDAITDTGSGAVLTPSELPGKLTDVRLLLVGEEHTDMDSHAVERRVIEELHRAGRHVLVGLEMYPYTAQSALDDWSAGKLSEDAFLESSHWYKHWGYNWFYYRDIFLFARENRLRVFGVNAPREVVSAVRKKGFQGLTPEEAAHIPTKIDTGSASGSVAFTSSSAGSPFTDGIWIVMGPRSVPAARTGPGRQAESRRAEPRPRTRRWPPQPPRRHRAPRPA